MPKCTAEIKNSKLCTMGFARDLKIETITRKCNLSNLNQEEIKSNSI